MRRLFCKPFGRGHDSYYRTKTGALVRCSVRINSRDNVAQLFVFGPSGWVPLATLDAGNGADEDVERRAVEFACLLLDG